jgi:sugar phosphate isomerase/epimerase
MKIGISTACLYPMHTEESLKILLDAGYRSFELFINSDYETEKTYIDTLKKMADEVGADFVSVHPYTAAMETMYFFSNYDRREEEGLKHYEKFLKTAKYLGAGKLVIHGQHVNRFGKYSLTDDEYCERYLKLSKLASEYGIRICQENVQSFRSGDVAFISSMHKILGNRVCFALDIKQTILAHQNMYDMMRAMGSQLVHLHLSDNTLNDSCCLPGSGTFDFCKLKEELIKMDFSGDIVIEVYGSAIHDNDDLLQSEKFTRNIFENII